MLAHRLSRLTAAVAAVLVLALSPMALVRATHDPQVADVVAVATSSTYNMTCKPSSTQVDCSAFDFDGTWTESATIRPGSGDLTSLYTLAAVSPQWGAPLYSSFRTWITDLQAVPCNGVSRSLTAFVASVGNLTSDGTVTPLTIAGECNLTGGLNVVRNVDGIPTEYDYWVNSTVIPPPTPTPSPTPTPTPTPTPSATPSPTPSATPGTGSPSSLASASASNTVAASQATRSSPPTAPSDTPEQGIGAGTGTPSEPSAGAGLPAGDQGWTAGVPSPDKVSTKPIDLASSLALALLLIFVMAFPGELFNDTFQANYDEIAGWFGWKKKS
jgi:hypothetical protein